MPSTIGARWRADVLSDRAVGGDHRQIALGPDGGCLEPRHVRNQPSCSSKPDGWSWPPVRGVTASSGPPAPRRRRARSGRPAATPPPPGRRAPPSPVRRVMDGESRDDEVERPRGRGSVKSATKSSTGKPSEAPRGRVQHVRTLVHAHRPRPVVAGQDRGQRLARAGAEVQHGRHLDPGAVRCHGHPLLEPAVGGNLLAHHVEVGGRVEVELAHAGRLRRPRRRRRSGPRPWSGAPDPRPAPSPEPRHSRVPAPWRRVATE